MESRVTKYEHRLQEVFNFTRHEIAILCELLLRGPQTPGELRNRADRMHKFEDLGIVQTTLRRLMEREPPLVKYFPNSRAPRKRATRISSQATCRMGTRPGGRNSYRRQLKRRRTNRAPRKRSRKPSEEIADFKQQFAAFRKQFE